MNIVNKKEQHWLWDPEAEMHVALLAKRLRELNPKLNVSNLIKELNYTYLRKRKLTGINNCGATLLQRYFYLRSK